jgi:hypothetical protein
MATKKAAAAAPAPVPVAPAAKPAAEERVRVMIPRGNSNDDPNFFVSVNGKNYLLPKGKESLVPASVAWEIERATKAQEKYNAKEAELIALAQSQR